MLARAFKCAAIGMVVIVVTLALAACARESQEEKRHFVIGLVTNNPNGLRNIQGFRDGMAELGHIEGGDVTYLFDGSPTEQDDLDAVLASLVEAEVDLIFTAGTPTGVAAHRVTAESEVPVIFGVIADPIAAGVVTDLTRPGGNMTGVRLAENQARRLEFLLHIMPGTKRVFVPYDPQDAASTSAVAQLEELAPHLEIEIVKGVARNDNQVTEMLDNVPEGIDAIFLVPGTTVNSRLPDILALALDRRLPISGPSTAQVEEGALFTFGFIHYQAGAQAARIAHQVLRGTHPGDVPVETAESYLVINAQTADAIGLEIPYDILQQAELIIRDQEQK